MCVYIQVRMRISCVLYFAPIAAASGLQSIWITINGPFIRLKETYKQTQRAMLKHVQMYPKTTAAHFNSHFTQLLRSR